MGSNSSSSSKKKENQIIRVNFDRKSEKKNDLFSLFQINTSSYTGIKSDISSQINVKENKESFKSMTLSEEIVEKKLEYQITDQKIKTTFYWKEPGNTVYITGNFSNWSQWFLMNKKGKEYSLILVKSL